MDLKENREKNKWEKYPETITEHCPERKKGFVLRQKLHTSGEATDKEKEKKYHICLPGKQIYFSKNE